MDDQIELITKDFYSKKFINYTLKITQEKQGDYFFSYRYCVFWHPEKESSAHLIHCGHGSVNSNSNITTNDIECEEMLERAVHKHTKGIWKRLNRRRNEY